MTPTAVEKFDHVASLRKNCALPSLDRGTSTQRAYIGATLNASPELQRQIFSECASTDLTDPDCVRGDRVLREMCRKGLPTDATTVVAYQRRTEGIPDRSYQPIASWWARINADAPPPITGLYLASVIREEGERREIERAGLTIARMARSGSAQDVQRVIREQCSALAAAVTRFKRATQ